jgi:hypothetical protein
MKSGSVSGTSMYRIIVALVVAAVLASENQEPMARSIKRRDDPLLKMGGILSKVYAEYMTGEENINSSALVNNVSDRLVHSDGSVSVDVVAFGTGTELQELVDELSLIGFQVSSTFHHIASGKIPVSALGDMCNCDKLVLARPVIVRRRAGSVLSEGVQAMEADTVLNNLGFDGTGVLVGVFSDSYNALGDEDIDIASGDLPSKVRITVLQDYHLHDASDEGRAMMQLIHDVAPRADLAFHTASKGMADFALGIIKLAGLGCQVIVDDIFIFGEPAFQDGIIAQAVNAVNEVGVAYFSAVGNDARQSYECPFVDSGQTLTRDGSAYNLHDFGYGSDPFAPQTHQTLYLPNFSDVYIDFQWDEPFVSVSGSPGSRSDLDMFLFDTPGEVILKGIC